MNYLCLTPTIRSSVKTSKSFQGNDYTEVSDPDMDSDAMVNYYELRDFYKLQDMKEKTNIPNQGTNWIYLTNISDSSCIISCIRGYMKYNVSQLNSFKKIGPTKGMMI